MSDAPKTGAMQSLMQETRKFPPPENIQKRAYISSMQQYQDMYDRSIKDPSGFWLEQANAMLTWIKKPTRGLEYNWDTKGRVIEHTWFADGSLNVSFNCLDRHLNTPNAKKTAIIFQGDEDRDALKLTYEELHTEVCKFANVLKAKGIKKGDRVAIYMPMVPELAVAMLALSSAVSALKRWSDALPIPNAKCSSRPTSPGAAARKSN
jgi:acetyl-CoA synthetase